MTAKDLSYNYYIKKYLLQKTPSHHIGEIRKTKRRFLFYAGLLIFQIILNRNRYL